MVSVKSFARNLIRNDIVFGATDSIISLVPHKRVLGDSDFVKRNLDKIPDPVILDYGSFKLQLDRNSSHDRDVYWDYLNGDYLDPLLSQVLKYHLKPGSVFLDIGANNGFFSLLASPLVGTNGIVYAFEPSVQTFERMKNNINLNNFKNIKSFNLALGNQSGIGTFYDFGRRDGSNSLVKMRSGQPKKVNMNTLDNVLDEYRVKPDFVKIDVEGFEKEVLDGGRESILNSSHMILVLEYNRHILRKKGELYSTVINLLVEYGFEIHEMNDVERTVMPNLVHSHKDVNPWGCNLLATK